MFDIAIIGAGPAGSTLAKEVGKKCKVLLVDKKDSLIKKPLGKCCGGLLAPDAQKILGEAGLALPKDVLVDPQIFAVRTIDFQANAERFYQRFYLNFDRAKFDKWLLSLVSSAVDFRNNAVLQDFTRQDDHFELKIFSEGKSSIERAKVLISAEGASSQIRRKIGGKNLPKTYVAVQEWFEAKEVLPYFSAIFDTEITDFYSWTIPKDNFLLVGSALLNDKYTNDKFELLKSRLRNYGFNFGKKVRREGALIFRPSAGDVFFGAENIGFVGEAAGLISPSSSEGLSYAIRSALAMAKALNDGLDGFLERYRKNVYSLKRNIALKDAKSCLMYNGFLRSRLMKSGFLSMDVE